MNRVTEFKILGEDNKLFCKCLYDADGNIRLMEKESNVQAEEQTAEPILADPIAVPKESEKPKEKEETVQTEQRGGKRESVLKALRERQNKLKAQEKTGEKQKDKSKDHKKEDIDL